jgi:hypothetical protein
LSEVWILNVLRVLTPINYYIITMKIPSYYCWRTIVWWLMVNHPRTSI